MSLQISLQKTFPLHFLQQILFLQLFSELTSVFPYPFKNADIGTRWILPVPTWPMLFMWMYLVAYLLLSNTFVAEYCNGNSYSDAHSWSLTYFWAKILHSVSMALISCSLVNNCVVNYVTADLLWIQQVGCNLFYDLPYLRAYSALLVLSTNTTERWFHAYFQTTELHNACKWKLKLNFEVFAFVL